MAWTVKYSSETRRPGFNPWVGKDPWRKAWQPTPCLENPHGQRSLAGYSPWGHKELDTTKQLGTTQQEISEKIIQMLVLFLKSLSVFIYKCLLLKPSSKIDDKLPYFLVLQVALGSSCVLPAPDLLPSIFSQSLSFFIGEHY